MTRRLAAAAAAAALAATTSACLDDYAPVVGPPNRAVCTPGDSDPAVAIRFETDILIGIFERDDGQCTACHTASGRAPLGLEIGGLDLSSRDTLLRGGAQAGAAIVRPGDPCASVLVQKVSETPPFGGRMPLDGPPFLTATDRQVLHDWIAEGALE